MNQPSLPTIPDQPWQEPTSAYPPRFWWLKRGVILFVVTLLALVGLRWWWGKIADDRLAEMIAAAHARGEPILPDDFNPAPLPDSQNAAMTLRLAADSIVRYATYDAFDNTWMGGPLTPSDVRQVDHVVSINQRPLQLCRVARSEPRVDWNIRITQPTLTVLLPYLNSQRGLAILLNYAAHRDHAIGDDSDAIEHARDILNQAKVLDHAFPCIVNHLVAIGINELATSLLEEITPDLQMEEAGSPTTKSFPAKREQIRAVIDDLLSENELTQSAAHSWQGEATGDLDTAVYLATKGILPVNYTPIPLNGSKALELISPMTELDGMRLSRSMSEVATAVAKLDWPTASASLPVVRRGDESELTEASQLFRIPWEWDRSHSLRRATEPWDKANLHRL